MSTHVSIFSWHLFFLISSSGFKYTFSCLLFTPDSRCTWKWQSTEKIDIFFTYKVSNTFQHKVQKDILWVGEWFRPCRCWCASCLRTQKITSPEITCYYTPSTTVSSFSHTNTVYLNWQSSWAFTSQSNVLWENLWVWEICADYEHFLSHFLHIYVFSLKLFHVSVKM